MQAWAIYRLITCGIIGLDPKSIIREIAIFSTTPQFDRALPGRPLSRRETEYNRLIALHRMLRTNRWWLTAR